MTGPADETLFRVAEQWAAAFNGVDPADVETLITEAVTDECFDHRTNLFLMARAEPTDVALVLSAPSDRAGDDTDSCLVVRWDGDAWVVDGDAVDWQSLEHSAFALDEPWTGEPRSTDGATPTTLDW
jgi:hypothetical protein